MLKNRLGALAVASLIPFSSALAQSGALTPTNRTEARWSIDPRPTLVLGDPNKDNAELFGGGLVGATRLPDGKIFVVDRGDYSLKLFDPSGKLVKSLGRKGSGPGELVYAAHLWRCGNDIVVYDIDGYRTTVYGLDGTSKRSFRFTNPAPDGQTPYQSACNSAGTFVHMGWEKRTDMKGGAFRSTVPLWFSGIDSTARLFGSMAGSERWGLIVDGRLRGTRPLPLGKQPVIAIGPDRAYVGTADTYEITMYDLQGKVIGKFGKPGVQLATTPADIEMAIEQEIAGQTEARQKSIRESFAEMQLPKTIPAYQRMIVDVEGMVWVQDYRRKSPTTAAWTVFTRDGKQIAEVTLPLHLTVTEIGTDYVLGKFTDPVEDIPQIHMYRLRR